MRQLSERRGSITDAQRCFLRRLCDEAFAGRWTFAHDGVHPLTGLDANHLERLSVKEASHYIDILVAAKAANAKKVA